VTFEVCLTQEEGSMLNVNDKLQALHLYDSQLLQDVVQHAEVEMSLTDQT